jgi:hypothetical protein
MPIEGWKKKYFKFIVIELIIVKLFYWLYFAPRGLYIHRNILPPLNSPEDEEITLRVYR